MFLSNDKNVQGPQKQVGGRIIAMPHLKGLKHLMVGVKTLHKSEKI